MTQETLQKDELIMRYTGSGSRTDLSVSNHPMLMAVVRGEGTLIWRRAGRAQEHD